MNTSVLTETFFSIVFLKITKFNSKIPYKIASIDELKEFHILLHDLTISKDCLAEKLKSYEESSFQLGPGQETFNQHLSALNQV